MNITTREGVVEGCPAPGAIIRLSAFCICLFIYLFVAFIGYPTWISLHEGVGEGCPAPGACL